MVSHPLAFARIHVDRCSIATLELVSRVVFGCELLRSHNRGASAAALKGSQCRGGRHLCVHSFGFGVSLDALFEAYQQSSL